MVNDSWIPAALAAGVPAEQLELHLQPVHALSGEALVGAETFVRWRHPEHGWVAIQRWYAEAARSGALVEFALVMLPVWAACTEVRAGIKASFNFGVEQLLDDRFMDAVLAIAHPAARGLTVEVDHAEFLRAAQADGAGNARPQVSELDDRLSSLTSNGFDVWLDDFGQGSYDEAAASHPSVAVVKLDRSLLAADSMWLRGLARRMHDAGKLVLMEGIETDGHRRFAIEAGLDWGQGFLYAAPLPPDAFAAYCLAAPSDNDAKRPRSPGAGAASQLWV